MGWLSHFYYMWRWSWCFFFIFISFFVMVNRKMSLDDYDMWLYLIIDERKKSNPRNWWIQFKVFNSPFDIIFAFVFFCLLLLLFMMYDSFRLRWDVMHWMEKVNVKFLRFHTVTVGNCFWVYNTVNMTKVLW